MSENFEIDYAFLSNNFNLVDTHSLTNIESSSLLLFESDTNATNPSDILKFNSVILNQDDVNTESNFSNSNSNGDTATTSTTVLYSTSNSNGANKESGELVNHLAAAESIDMTPVLETESESFLHELVDDCIFGLLLQVHRAAKLGYLLLNEQDQGQKVDQTNSLIPSNQTNDASNYNQFQKEPYFSDHDVLGFYSNCNENSKVSGGKSSQSNSVNNALLKYECACPNCGRNIAAIRFAPHLEKCMGMGRSSSRIATRRIANYNGDELDQLIEATGIIYPKTSDSALHSSLSTSSLTSSTSSSLYSSSSTSMLNSYDQYFKQPVTKKRRIQPLTKSATTILPVQAQTNQKSNMSLQTSLTNSLHGHSPMPATHALNANPYLIENYSSTSSSLKVASSSLYGMASSSSNQPTTSSTNN